MNKEYDKRQAKNRAKAFKDTDATVKPVAKDTNKTRRKETTKRIVGITEKQSEPKSRIKADMKRPIKTTRGCK